MKNENYLFLHIKIFILPNEDFCNIETTKRGPSNLTGSWFVQHYRIDNKKNSTIFVREVMKPLKDFNLIQIRGFMV
jgi:hypothetical protein